MTSHLETVFQNLKASPASYIGASRQLKNAPDAQSTPLKAYFLNTFTLNLVEPYLTVEAARRGISLDCAFGPFNQLEQVALDPTHELYETHPKVLVIATRLEDLLPNLGPKALAAPALVDAALAQLEERLRFLFQTLKKNGAANLLVFNFAPPDHLTHRLGYGPTETSAWTFAHRANEALARVSREFAGTFVFDYAGAIYHFGAEAWTDAKMHYLGRAPLSVAAQIYLAQKLARYFKALVRPALKCLVLDLDNTLWGGIVGEDGVGGIHIGDDFPGNVFRDFQRDILALRDRGVLLAIASKNNEADVLEVFEKRTEMLLKWEHFSCTQVGWHDKAESLRSIAKQLNIGLEALAFFDDNPVERAFVREELPQVTVIEAKDPITYARALENSGAFDSLSISQEDLKRSQLYEEEKARTQMQGSITDLNDFIKRLEVEVEVSLVTTETLPRVVQLINKTNQFNLTTQRLTEAELNALLAASGVALSLKTADKFGDQGLVGVAIAQLQSEGTWSIHSFLMSCRVIGRKLENALLEGLVTAVSKRGAQELVGQYLPTPKNALVKDFFATQGFSAVPGKEGFWKLNPNEFSFCDKAIFKKKTLDV